MRSLSLGQAQTRHATYLLLMLSSLLLLASCASSTRYIAEGEHLLRRVRIHIDDSLQHSTTHLDKEELRAHISQLPNSRILGLYPLSLATYNTSNIKSNSWLNRLLRRWGSPAVVYNPTESEHSASTLTSTLYNKGYLGANTIVVVDTISPKKVAVDYHLQPGDLYKIGRSYESIADSSIANALHLATQNSTKHNHRYIGERYDSYLISGAPLSPENMQSERNRIARILHNRGYWDFSEDQIYYEVDTTQHQSAWVKMVIDSHPKPYTISGVRLWHAVSDSDKLQIPSNRIDGLDLRISPKYKISPKVLRQRVSIHSGELYSEGATNQTYALLSELPNIHNVQIVYRPDSIASSQDTAKLWCDIITTEEKRREFLIDLIGTHSSGNLGLQSSLTYRHYNLLGRGDQFSIKGNIGYEDLQGDTQDHFSTGVESSLSFPYILSPFGWARKTRGKTDFSIGYDYQARPEFARNMLSSSWSYSWRPLLDPRHRHTLRILEIDYLNFSYIDETFKASLPLLARQLSYRNQFVTGISYLYNYNSRQGYSTAMPYYYNLRLYLQSAGNLLYAISTATRSKQDEYGAYSLLGINFAQFVKAEIDYSASLRLADRTSLAYRAGVGVVVPYSNSRILPIDFRYFSGGANSLRGWSLRTIGPGSIPRSKQLSTFNQVGDIKLDLNAELRQRVATSWEIALFLDTGNIWTIRDYSNQPEGAFKWNKFYQQLALSTGVGLRWDFDYFLLRFDTGLQLHDPQAKSSEQWVVGHKKLKDMLAFHFAIGYPF